MYQVLIEKATSIPRRAGYTDFTGHYDPSLFEMHEFDEPPNGLEVLPFLSPDQQIAAGRQALTDLYLSAPLNLQKLFAIILAQVFPALDMKAYDLAIALVQDVDISVVQDDTERALADSLKGQILAGLAGLKTI
jgi:hypothetical protein